jgi:hypothetical protein
MERSSVEIKDFKVLVGKAKGAAKKSIRVSIHDRYDNQIQA